MIIKFVILIVGLIFCLKIKRRNRREEYKGLVLFDIDGTLTTGNYVNNEKVVQTCLENGFAVGICTAGRIYSMDNILSYPWMPRNLYDFIQKHNIGFNNVASGVLMGKKNPQAYMNLNTRNPGILKGFAMEKTGKAFGITNDKRIILCDDQKSYLIGVHKYNPNFTLVCAGEDCGGKLTVEAVKAGMSQS